MKKGILLDALLPNIQVTVTGETPLIDKLSPFLAATEKWLSDVFTSQPVFDTICQYAEASDSARGIESYSNARAQAGSNEVQQSEPSDEKSEGAPEEVAVAESPLFKQFCDLKKKHPDSLLLFRRGDFYECYEEDAIKAAEVLCLTQVHNTKDNITMAGFPHHALDTYLPRLIRHGIRVAICDDITDFCKPAKHNESANAVQQELFLRS